MPALLRAFLILLTASSSLAAQEDDDADLRRTLRDYPHKLLFETDRDGNWELYVMNADGSNPVNLTRTPRIHEVYPKVSPDGRWIAFCADSERDGKRIRDVYRMRIDGSERAKVAENARDPFWRPDGKELGFLPSEYRRFSFATWATRGLRIHSFETGKNRDHPNDELEHLYTPTFSKDGRWILATVHGGMGYGHAILAIAANGTDVYPLRLMGCRADLAPDGRSLTWGLGDYALGIATLDLSGERPRTQYEGKAVRNSYRDGQTYHADWSPDGRFIAYSCGPKARRRSLWASVMPQCPGVEAKGWDVWVADAKGTNVRVRLTRNGRSNKEPDWIPVRPAAADGGEVRKGK